MMRRLAARPRCGVVLLSFLLTSIPAFRVDAQDPVKLPGVVIKASPPLPGPRRLTGIVRDTTDVAVELAEVSIPALQQRVFSKADGSFLFADIPEGRYAVRAKKLGYAPQVRTIEVGKEGGIGEFSLLPLLHALPPVLSSAARGGLSGVIADTSYRGMPGAEVRVLGKNMFVETDSTGAFFLPVPTGSYMVTVTKNGFSHRVVSVTVPADSGRYLTASLLPSSAETPVREAWNLSDLNARLAGRNKQKSSFYTRQELKEKGIEWVHEAVVMGGLDQYDNDCMAVLNGGPATIDMSTLTVDDIESIEIYGSRRETGQVRRSRNLPSSAPQKSSAPRPARFTVPMPISNSDRAAFQNQSRYCATVYVWTR